MPKYRIPSWLSFSALALALAGCSSEPNANLQPTAADTPPPTLPPTATTTAGAAAARGAATNGGAGTPAPAGARATAGAVGQSAGSSAAEGGAGAAGSTLPPDAGAAGSTSGASAPPDAGPAPAPCPATRTLAAGDNASMLEHQARRRRYNVYVPPNLPADMRVPLVFDFHGNGSSAAQEQNGSGWQQKADAEGFLVAYPDGVGGSWNVGNCCGEALSGNVDDVGFVRAMIDAISGAACVDPKRIYATGISNGGGFSHRLACEAADVIAAVGVASADLVTDPCKPARPIAEISVRGLNDTLVAYEGGNTGSTGWYSPGAKGTLMLWKDINGCTGMPEKVLDYCETYQTCNAGVEVTLCSLPNTGHILYRNSLNFDVPKIAWEMFERQIMP